MELIMLKMTTYVKQYQCTWIPGEAKFSQILSVSFVHWIENSVKLSSQVI